MISAVRYGSGFGFIGFYIVRPNFRGQGYGLQIWNAAMARLAGRTIGLDGVVAQQDNYRKSGFVLAWNNARFEGLGGGPRPADGAIGSALCSHGHQCADRRRADDRHRAPVHPTI